MNEEMVVFPQYVDNFLPIMFWEMDDFIPLFLGFEGGLLASTIVDHPVIQIGGILIGIYASAQYIKTKKNNLSGLIFHKGYAFGVYRLNKVFQYGAMKRWIH